MPQNSKSSQRRQIKAFTWTFISLRFFRRPLQTEEVLCNRHPHHNETLWGKHGAELNDHLQPMSHPTFSFFLRSEFLRGLKRSRFFRGLFGVRPLLLRRHGKAGLSGFRGPAGGSAAAGGRIAAGRGGPGRRVHRTEERLRRRRGREDDSQAAVHHLAAVQTMGESLLIEREVDEGCFVVALSCINKHTWSVKTFYSIPLVTK